jgi:hypothetical protein
VISQTFLSFVRSLDLNLSAIQPKVREYFVKTPFGDDGSKAAALGSLAECLPEPRRTEVLEQALTAAARIGDDRYKVRASAR